MRLGQFTDLIGWERRIDLVIEDLLQALEDGLAVNTSCVDSTGDVTVNPAYERPRLSLAFMLEDKLCVATDCGGLYCRYARNGSKFRGSRRTDLEIALEPIAKITRLQDRSPSAAGRDRRACRW